MHLKPHSLTILSSSKNILELLKVPPIAVLAISILNKIYRKIVVELFDNLIFNNRFLEINVFVHW